MKHTTRRKRRKQAKEWALSRAIMRFQNQDRGPQKILLYFWGKGINKQKTNDCRKRQSFGQKRGLWRVRLQVVRILRGRFKRLVRFKSHKRGETAVHSKRIIHIRRKRRLADFIFTFQWFHKPSALYSVQNGKLYSPQKRQFPPFVGGNLTWLPFRATHSLKSQNFDAI